MSKTIQGIPGLHHLGSKLPCLTCKMATSFGSPWRSPAALVGSSHAHRWFLASLICSPFWLWPQVQAQPLGGQARRARELLLLQVIGGPEATGKTPGFLTQYRKSFWGTSCIWKKVSQWPTVTHSPTFPLLPFLPSNLTQPLSTCACWVHLLHKLLALKPLP